MTPQTAIMFLTNYCASTYIENVRKRKLQNEYEFKEQSIRIYVGREQTEMVEKHYLYIKGWIPTSQCPNLIYPWKERSYRIDEKHTSHQKNSETSVRNGQKGKKRHVTLSIIFGMNFCPPKPGSTVITRTISTGFSPSTCY